MSQNASDEVFGVADERRFAAFENGLEEGLIRLAREVAEAAGREQGWSARVRAGLEAMLEFLDDQPLWGRRFLSEAPPKVELERARRVKGLLAELLDEQSAGRPGREQGVAGAARSGPDELTRELVLGGVLSVIRERLLHPSDTPGTLVALAPSLMSFIVTAYLGYPATGPGQPPAGSGTAAACAQVPAQGAVATSGSEHGDPVARAREPPVAPAFPSAPRIARCVCCVRSTPRPDRATARSPRLRS